MNDTDFKGFTGIHLDNITFSNDIMLLIVLLLLLAFAIIFRLNTSLLGKMIGNIKASEQRQSIFETTANDNFLFNAFMIFQTLLLCSILLYSTISEYKDSISPDPATMLVTTSILLIIILVFLLFKKSIYTIFGYIFTDKDITKAMLISHQSLFCLWGVSLYFPVLWVLLIGKYYLFAIIIVIISYLVFRATLILRFVYIFLNRNTGLLFLSLYLCAQEIVPLVFLYKGLIYMYNIIEKNNT